MQDLTDEFTAFSSNHDICNSALFSKLDTFTRYLDAAIESQQSETQIKNMDMVYKTLSKEINTVHKESFNLCTKFSKNLDKHRLFKADLDQLWDPKAVDKKEALINEAIYLHLIRQGQFKVAQEFSKETNVNSSDDTQMTEQFIEMYRIVEDVKQYNLESAITWCQSNKLRLEKIGSVLEFELHKTKFILLTNQMQIKEALQYAKLNFKHFAPKHTKEIQKLMGSLIFVKRASTSPYTNFSKHDSLAQIQHLITKDFCLLVGLASESPLYTVVTIGASALQTIMKMTSILKGKSGLEWSQDGELPVEIPLLDEHRYHSVFICPVSKEQATQENPAMLMACGHVLVKESLNRLGKGNSLARFKCPYCPVESTGAQAQAIYF